MMQIPENILVLIAKYQSGQITVSEKKILDEWYHSFDDSITEVNDDIISNEQHLEARIRTKLLATVIPETATIQKEVGQQRGLKLAMAAAVILMLFSATTYYFVSGNKSKESVTKQSQVKPAAVITPGSNKAVLILSDGSEILLDSAANGTLSQQGNIQVQKLENGLLAYKVNGRLLTENDEAFYNTISTPRGGQYQVTLSDGTVVWLNAASSIRFPVVFTGKERKVTITGEAYFEVAKNKQMPFKVAANGSEVEVLGTHFNVNAYDDEASVRTTLLEGSVKVSVSNSTSQQTAKFLKPGQQAGISKEGRIDIISGVDTEEAVAWKNGLFIFNSTDVKSIMRQISRWYNVDVEYRGNVNLHFTGQLARKDDVSSVFEKMAMTGEVHFTINGKRVIVSP